MTKNIRTRTLVISVLVGLVLAVAAFQIQDVRTSLVTIVVGLGALAVALVALYGLTVRLPGRWRERSQAFVFLFPAILCLFAGLLVPALKTIYASFRDDNLKRTKYVGLKNFKEIFTTRDAQLVVFNTFAWVILGTIAVVFLAITVARFADAIKGEKLVKSLLFVPTCVSLAGAGIIWKFVYASPPSRVGLLSAITKGLRLPSSYGGDGEYLWLSNRGYGGIKPPATAPGYNTLLLIVIFIWASSGVATMILSAAIKGVPESLIEAAKIDGATNRQAFYKVTLPYIRSTIITVATFTVIGAFKAYDIIAGTTGGNAGTANIATEWYTKYFLQDREGYSSALAVLMFVFVIPFVVLNRRAQRRAEEMMAG